MSCERTFDKPKGGMQKCPRCESLVLVEFDAQGEQPSAAALLEVE